MRLQPSNPQTWITLGRFDLTRNPKAAVQELRAGIYLDPASISPEALAAAHVEAIETYNAYVQALRAVAAEEASSKAPTHGAREQQPARAGRPAGGPHVDLLEAEIGDAARAASRGCSGAGDRFADRSARRTRALTAPRASSCDAAELRAC